MKIFKLVVIIAICSLNFTSCKDDNPAAPTYESIDAGSLQASVGDEFFVSTNVNTSQFEPDLIKINASATTSGISLVLTDWQIGQYPIGGNNNENYILYSNLNSPQDFSVYTSEGKTNTTGTVNILAVDEENKTLSGTFDGLLVLDTDSNDTIIIKDGMFNQVPY